LVNNIDEEFIKIVTKEVIKEIFGKVMSFMSDRDKKNLDLRIEKSIEKNIKDFSS